MNENFTHAVSYLADCVFYKAFNSFHCKIQATSPNGGWTTKSELTVLIDHNDRNKMVSCYAVNQELGETTVETHMISVLCKFF